MSDPITFDVDARQGPAGSWTAQVRQVVPACDDRVSKKEYALSRAGLMTEIFKALLLINGGGAIALLTVLKEVATPKEKVYSAMAAPTAIGVILMSLGLLAAVMSAILRFQHSKEAEKCEHGDPNASVECQTFFQWAYLLALFLSAACFAVAAIWVGWPILRVLGAV